MSPERAKIFIVEDDKDSLEIDSRFLERIGHKIVERASSLVEALRKIPELDKKGVHVAIVDGNLSGEDRGGRDGEKVAREIKAQHPDIKVIGHALEKPILGADFNSLKIDGWEKLAKTVKKA